jgi:hypothetical protein
MQLEGLYFFFYLSKKDVTGTLFLRQVEEEVQSFQLHPHMLFLFLRGCRVITFHLFAAPSETRRAYGDAIGRTVLLLLPVEERRHWYATSEQVQSFQLHPHMLFLFLRGCRVITFHLFAARADLLQTRRAYGDAIGRTVLLLLPVEERRHWYATSEQYISSLCSSSRFITSDLRDPVGLCAPI